MAMSLAEDVIFVRSLGGTQSIPGGLPIQHVLRVTHSEGEKQLDIIPRVDMAS